MRTPQKKLNPLNIRMTDEMREELAEIAEAENRTISNLVVTVLQSFLETRRKEQRKG
jgi:predicted transcriptional regulator